MKWTDDSELFRLIREKLFTAAIGDVLDSMGLRRQFLPPGIQPLRPDMVVLGRAMPVLEADCFDGKGFGLMLHALDDLKPNEVYIASGGTPRYALWGELMSTRARVLGAAGAVLNGFSRDTGGILSLDFPTFSLGRYAQDQACRGKVIDFRAPLEIEAVKVEPGDIVFGDIDGVLVVPKVAEVEAISRALEKASTENLVRKAIVEGMSTVEAFDKFGVM
ncbi:MAG TPA: RraA family protein [Bryobacteraceae bacterium]|nr:RraA family protein [Bryobacteraceae bacterium]